MTETATIRRITRVNIRTVYTPKEYARIAPGSVLLWLDAGSLWRTIDSNDDSVTVFPYSGGASITLLSSASDVDFGLIEHLEVLPEVISL